MALLQKVITKYGGFKEVSDSVGFGVLDGYSDHIYQQFCDTYTNASYLTNVEWMLRHFTASKKMTLSVLFFTQSQYLVNHNMKNIAFYSLYYAIFNALLSNVLLLPKLAFDEVKRISHGKIFKYIENHFVNQKIYSYNVIKLLNELRLMREMYSYHLPLGGSFIRDGKNIEVGVLFEKVNDVLPILLQLSNLLSYLSHYAWDKKVGKALDEYDKYQSEVDQMFFSVIEHHDHLGQYCLIDNDDYQRQGYALHKWKTPFPISWFITEKMCEDLECGWETMNEECYDINEVGQYLANVIGAL